MLRSLNTLRTSVNPIFLRHVLALRLLEFVARFSDLTTTIVQQHPNSGPFQVLLRVESGREFRTGFLDQARA